MRLQRALIAMVMLPAAMIAACSAEPSPSAGEEELDQVTIGVIPTADAAPAYLGEEVGIFEEHGIDLIIESGSGGAAITPSVLNGEFDFGITNVVSLAIARTEGLPLSIVAPTSQTTGVSGADYGAIVASQQSDIQGIDDLEGARVGINGLLNANDVLIRAGMEAAGADPEAVDFVEIPFSEMPAMLSTGEIDAAFAPEPFMTMSINEGAREVFSLFADVVENYPSAVYFATDEVAGSDLSKRFRAAMVEANAYATGNEEEAREIVTSYTEMDLDFINQLTMPAWPGEVDTEAVRRLVELTSRYGIIPSDEGIADAILPDEQ